MSRDEARAALEWLVAMGADEALDETPVDRFTAAPQPPPAPAVGATAAPVEPRPGAGAALSAREIAAAAPTLEALRAALEAFEGCALKATATRLAFADGTPGARVMLIGEAPGRDEDLQGVPFVGRSGRLLDRMLAAIGLDRSSVYVANVVPWRPPGNRTPTPEEVQTCLPFLERQIELADPDVLVLLGGAAAAALTGSREGILKLRGRWLLHHRAGRDRRALATLHPAYLLRNPISKRLAWRDLLALKRSLG